VGWDGVGCGGVGGWVGGCGGGGVVGVGGFMCVGLCVCIHESHARIQLLTSLFFKALRLLAKVCVVHNGEKG